MSSILEDLSGPCFACRMFELRRSVKKSRPLLISTFPRLSCIVRTVADVDNETEGKKMPGKARKDQKVRIVLG